MAAARPTASWCGCNRIRDCSYGLLLFILGTRTDQVEVSIPVLVVVSNRSRTNRGRVTKLFSFSDGLAGLFALERCSNRLLPFLRPNAVARAGMDQLVEPNSVNNSGLICSLGEPVDDPMPARGITRQIPKLVLGDRIVFSIAHGEQRRGRTNARSRIGRGIPELTLWSVVVAIVTENSEEAAMF
jgi:hypothetical protein